MLAAVKVVLPAEKVRVTLVPEMTLLSVCVVLPLNWRRPFAGSGMAVVPTTMVELASCVVAMLAPGALARNAMSPPPVAPVTAKVPVPVPLPSAMLPE